MNKQCECCLSANNLMRLTNDHCNLITSCFSIKVSTSCLFDKSLNFICDLCIMKVNETFVFRTQILTSQAKLKELYSSSNKIIQEEMVIKVEPVFKEEFLSDCVVDSFDDSIKGNNPPLEENSNNQTTKENELNEPSCEENEISEGSYDPLLDSDNSSIEKSEITKKISCKLKKIQRVKKKVFKKRGLCKNVESEAKKMLVEKELLTQIAPTILEKESISELDLKLKMRGSSSYPFNIKKTALVCEECGEVFTTHPLLLSHLKVHFLIYVCETCEKIFEKRKGYMQHMKIHNETKFPCAVCQKLIRSSYTAIHMKTHKKDILFDCSHCSEKFPTHYKSLIHMNTVHKVDIYKYQCKICPKKYCVAKRLNEHVEVRHLKNINVTSDVSGLRFFDKNELNRHIRERAGENTHECHICQKKFRFKNRLMVHIAKHTNENKKYQCDNCDSWYSHKRNLVTHIKINHL